MQSWELLYCGFLLILQITFICIRYPVQSVVCEGHTPNQKPEFCVQLMKENRNCGYLKSRDQTASALNSKVFTVDIEINNLSDPTQKFHRSDDETNIMKHCFFSGIIIKNVI